MYFLWKLQKCLTKEFNSRRFAEWKWIIITCRFTENRSPGSLYGMLSLQKFDTQCSFEHNGAFYTRMLSFGHDVINLCGRQAFWRPARGDADCDWSEWDFGGEG